MRVLISGAGIAGPTLAYWLHEFGLTPTIVERAPTLRTGGYVIDFWGVGFDVAERMGLLPDIRREGYMVGEVRVVGRMASASLDSRSTRLPGLQTADT
jgi:2-polyprenyl-6-methoxyphenol hydroxylase-like FAD-dependent oxidoreductase